MLTQANDGLRLHLLVLVLGEIQKQLQHFVLYDNLGTTNKTSTTLYIYIKKKKSQTETHVAKYKSK